MIVPFQQAWVRIPNLGVWCKKWFNWTEESEKKLTPVLTASVLRNLTAPKNHRLHNPGCITVMGSFSLLNLQLVLAMINQISCLVYDQGFFKVLLWWPQGNFKRPLGGIWETVLHWCDLRSLYFERPLEEFERPFWSLKTPWKNTVYDNHELGKKYVISQWLRCLKNI